MMTFRKERMVLCYNLYGKSTKSMLFPILVVSGLCYFYFSSSDSSPPQEELIETIQPIEEKI